MTRSAVVLGAGRSGTSLVAGLLADAGLVTGHRLIPASPANPTGFHEDLDVNALNDELLAPHLGPEHDASGTRLAWLAALGGPLRLDATPGQRVRMAHLLRHRPACLKDPRLSHTLGAWRPELPADTALIAVFRHPASAIRSVQREAGRDPTYYADFALDDDHLAAMWAAANRRILDEHAAVGTWTFVDADRLMTTGDVGALAGAVDAPVPASRIDPGLRRSHRPGDTLPPPLQGLYEELLERARQT